MNVKGLIIAAGYGTRFLPATKTVAKEMLPLLDKPSIAFIIEEFVNSGIKDIVVVTSRRKKCLDDFFDRDIELEQALSAKNKVKELNLIKPYDVNVSFVRQQEMKGVGHAMMQAESFIGDNPFVVAYPDDLHFGETPLAKQLIDVYEKTNCSVLATLHNPPELNDYAAIAIAPDNLHITGMVEKPKKGEEPSKEASIGRYLYTPEIFTELKKAWATFDGVGEFYHVHGLNALIKANKVVYKRLEGERYDTGNPTGFLKATIAYAIQNPELRKVLVDEVSKIK